MKLITLYGNSHTLHPPTQPLWARRSLVTSPRAPRKRVGSGSLVTSRKYLRKIQNKAGFLGRRNVIIAASRGQRSSRMY